MSATIKKYLFIVLAIIILAGILFFVNRKSAPAIVVVAPPTVYLSPAPTFMPARAAKLLTLKESPLKANIIAAGEYLARQQLPNGELAYQVDIFTSARAYSPQHIRLLGATGSLYTVCRVSNDSKYCNAGDLALEHYLQFLVSDSKKFKGTCFYAEGNCPLSGAALMVDTIYKRWQASCNFLLADENLLNTAVESGYFIVAMRKADGGFYQAYDPHIGGAADADYFAAYSAGQSLLALVELYEMTGNDFWLQQAREVNAFMITQPVTESHWHGYALSKLAQENPLTKVDIDYGRNIAQVIIAGEVRSLNPTNSAASTATKIEGLAALGQVFYFSKEKYKGINTELQTLITFVQARQLPNNNCGWEISAQMTEYFGGGIFNSCVEKTIRVDGLQNWINGLTAYLEYASMMK